MGKGCGDSCDYETCPRDVQNYEKIAYGVLQIVSLSQPLAFASHALQAEGESSEYPP